MDQNGTGWAQQSFENASGRRAGMRNFKIRHEESACNYFLRRQPILLLHLELKGLLSGKLVVAKIHETVRSGAPRELFRELWIRNDQKLQLGKLDLVDDVVEVLFNQLPGSVEIRHCIPFNQPPIAVRCTF